ncbi:kinase domain protein (macronuclear) [Tetrahymena thermophila SB210]|uniref:Kinase domain protein n=1 Tax=Tetrahymena thermophila (strain SB210) TaxID=312017 RepID=Q245X4_TETTS|nr:kinase domain protein [Tetrahymena thermophila SB210]EAS03509.1 kinase domain protein [Tetrahymena thermophila SB210]|eukprot:XP_001023754.1 kinase domain protein [Tetrahymena thermophila SB210]
MIQSFQKFYQLLSEEQNSSNLKNSIDCFSYQKSLSFKIGYQKKIGVHGSKIISDGLQLFTSLEDLSIDLKSGNQIYSEGMEFIAKSFLYLQKLKRLHISIEFNFIREEGAIELGKGLAHLSNLVDLSVIIRSFNNIKSSGAIGLGFGLKNLLNLTKLQVIIEYNEIGQEGSKSLLESISKLYNLIQLHIQIGNDNYIFIQGALALGNCFLSLKKLEILECIICDNNIQSKGAQGIAKGIKENGILKKLKLVLESNNILNQGFQSICEGIKYNKQLTQLQIKIGYSNQINFSQITYLGQCLEGLLFIKILDIDLIFDDEEEENINQDNGRIQALNQFIDLIKNIKQLYFFKFNLQFKKQIAPRIMRKLQRVVIFK